MNWFTENKVFSSFLVLIGLAVAALLYLTFSARGAYTTAVESYQANVLTLSSLRGKAPFRNQENLTKIREQVESYKSLNESLRDNLMERQGAIPTVEPAAFQARLREAVSRIVKLAGERKVALPEKFYLGFDRYENELPGNEVAGLLSWQLDAIESVVTRLIDLKSTSISALLRSPIPGEAGAPVAPAPAARPAGPGVAKVPERLLIKYPFQVVFQGYPGQAQSILNEITAHPRFMIVRAIKIENEALTTPVRGSVTAENTAPEFTPDDAPKPPEAVSFDKVILGKERITTSMIIDLVQFTPKTPASK